MKSNQTIALSTIHHLLDDHYAARMAQGRKNLEPRNDVLTGMVMAAQMMEQFHLTPGEWVEICMLEAKHRGWVTEGVVASPDVNIPPHSLKHPTERN